jgi:hypothetical protein
MVHFSLVIEDWNIYPLLQILLASSLCAFRDALMTLATLTDATAMCQNPF